MTRAGAVLALLAACGPKEIPPHLRMDPPVSAQAQQARPQTLYQALILLVGTDPLLRRASPRGRFWDAVPDGELPAGLGRRGPARRRPPRTGGGSRPPAGQHRRAAGPGARLAALEAAAAGPRVQRGGGPGDAVWLGPIVVEGGTLPPGARGPLEWISQDPEEARKAALRIGERAVLLGWLDGPQIPVIAAAAALQPGVYDRLIDSPTGALLLARAAGSTDAAAFENGRQHLIRATSLALQAVAADRDSEQEAWRAMQDALKAELGEQPVARLLRQGAEALTRDAANPEAVGLALVALSAERIMGDCPDSPCRGLDRVGIGGRRPLVAGSLPERRRLAGHRAEGRHGPPGGHPRAGGGADRLARPGRRPRGQPGPACGRPCCAPAAPTRAPGWTCRAWPGAETPPPGRAPARPSTSAWWPRSTSPWPWPPPTRTG